MTAGTPASGADHLWKRIVELESAERGHLLQGDLLAQLLAQWPGHADAALMQAARLSAERKFAEVETTLVRAHLYDPAHAEVALQLGLARASQGNFVEALVPLRAAVEHHPEHTTAWLMLGTVLARLGRERDALVASHRAVTQAQSAGQWLDERTTPQTLLKPVIAAIQRVRTGRAELLRASFADLREAHGRDALSRLDAALDGYLQAQRALPDDAQHRPLFFWFSGLPEAPFHDPELQPWASRLRDAYPEIRHEALSVLARREEALPDFIRTATPEEQKRHLGGQASSPRWQAFFFYRHGLRFDANHRECPITSAVLESLDLCRIEQQAPEICFSVLAPRTDIKPHHGVTNARLVMHLPLVVPSNCALNLVDRGIHEWQEGRLVMFDDTYLHEAWNRSDEPRVILLMDCWNPHLTPVERQAFAQLVAMFSSLNPAAAAGRDQR